MGYYEEYSEPLDQLASKTGYRVRLSWIWHLENEGYLEIVLDIDNDGLAEVSGALRISITDAEITGSIDPGFHYPENDKLHLYSQKGLSKKV